jgi:hypothetical protein
VKTERLLLQDIETGGRLRAVDPAKVSGIKASIREIGLRTPITVAATRDGDDWSFRLVAGAHRLEALRQLGEEFVDAYVMEGDPEDIELWEIDENFARAELSDAQRAEHHVRREAILIRKGVVSSGPGQPKKNSAKLAKYSELAATALGVGERTVHRDLARGKKIDPEVLAEVAGTALDKGVVLDELASTPREQQREKLSEIASRGLRARVSPAPDPLNELEATEKQLTALMAAWNRAGAEARRRFLEVVDVPVLDRGRAA